MLYLGGKGAIKHSIDKLSKDGKASTLAYRHYGIGEEHQLSHGYHATPKNHRQMCKDCYGARHRSPMKRETHAYQKRKKKENTSKEGGHRVSKIEPPSG